METAKIHTLADGTALYYRISRASRGSRGVIVLLHGMASNLTRWSEFVEHTTLKNDWDVLRLDLRGHGESLTRRRIGMDVWSRDLVELLDAEGYDRAVLIGHSLGAHLALYFTGRFPTRVRAVVLIDPLFSQALRPRPRWLQRLRPLLNAGVALIRLFNAMGIYRRQLPRRDLRALDDQVRLELINSGNASAFVQRYSSPWEDLRFFPTAHYLKEVTEMMRPLPAPSEVAAPMLVLLSRSVTYTDPDKTMQLLREAHNANYESVDAYHWPLTERPEQVRQSIECWIEKRLAN
ncbi:MAG: alpha/beta fold hydrolase [Sulfurifustaceae bacterium]